MNIPNVYEYIGQYSVTFTIGNVSKNTWTDWGLIPSSRQSDPAYSIWSQSVNNQNTNGSDDLLRRSIANAVNHSSELRNTVKNDNRDRILSQNEYDLYQPRNGSMSFIIADQQQPFFLKQQEIVNFLHGQMVKMTIDGFFDEYEARVTVDSYNSKANFGDITISYSILREL